MVISLLLLAPLIIISARFSNQNARIEELIKKRRKLVFRSTVTEKGQLYGRAEVNYVKLEKSRGQKFFISMSDYVRLREGDQVEIHTIPKVVTFEVNVTMSEE